MLSIGIDKPPLVESRLWECWVVLVGWVGVGDEGLWVWQLVDEPYEYPAVSFGNEVAKWLRPCSSTWVLLLC